MSNHPPTNTTNLARPYTITVEEAVAMGHKFIAQPKLDGIRGYWDPEKGTLTGKDGQTLNADPVCTKLATFSHSPYIDGELWKEGWSFEQILSDYRLTGGANLDFYAFDINMDSKQACRLAALSVYGSIKSVPSIFVNPSDIPRVHTENLARGYEGTILRRHSRSFAGGGIFKIKPTLDFEATMIDYDGLSGLFSPLPNPSGDTPIGNFRCRIRGGVFPGDIVTVICNGLTAKNKPKNPRLK